MNTLRVIYKVVDGAEIDADVYLPGQSDTQGQHGLPVVINIHGGAFMLGASSMVNRDQITDCLSRGWIVVVPNHRLCPQVKLLDGPMRDCRDLLEWIYDGRLDDCFETQHLPHSCDLRHVFAFGTSSGGHLALSLGYGVSRPVAGIFDMYAPCKFGDPFWTTPIPAIASKLPRELAQDIWATVNAETPVAIRGGVSLEGQAPGPPDFSDARQAFAFWHIGNGKIMDVLASPEEWDRVDPIRNIGRGFPPTFIVHGQDDNMVPIELSRGLLAELQKHAVSCGMADVPGEGHTFAARMEVGSPTWDLQRKGFDFLENLVDQK